jgi:hypothetical protein
VLFQNKINLRYCASGWYYYRSLFRDFRGTPDVMRLLARPRIRWADNVNIDLNSNKMRRCVTFIWLRVGLMGEKGCVITG